MTIHMNELMSLYLCIVCVWMITEQLEFKFSLYVQFILGAIQNGHNGRTKIRCFVFAEIWSFDHCSTNWHRPWAAQHIFDMERYRYDRTADSFIVYLQLEFLYGTFDQNLSFFLLVLLVLLCTYQSIDALKVQIFSNRFCNYVRYIEPTLLQMQYFHDLFRTLIIFPPLYTKIQTKKVINNSCATPEQTEPNTKLKINKVWMTFCMFCHFAAVEEDWRDKKTSLHNWWFPRSEYAIYLNNAMFASMSLYWRFVSICLV